MQGWPSLKSKGWYFRHPPFLLLIVLFICLSLFQPLYSPLDENRTLGDDQPRNFNQGNINCVICWNSPASHALLPCRHACLCSQCFKRIENCPVCRTRVISFFLV